MASRRILKMTRTLLPVLLGLAVLPASALTSEPIPNEQGASSGRSVRSVPVSPLTIATFEQLRRETLAQLKADEAWHRAHAEKRGVKISSGDYARGLRELGGAQVVSELDWKAQMTGLWAPCAKTDACTAIVDGPGRKRTVTLVRASAIPHATSREVIASQLRDLLEHEFAHILLLAVGYEGNQEVFITEQWTLGAPDSALASHKRCSSRWC